MNQIAFDFVKAHEGLRLTAYQDRGSVWTIGYGHTGPDVTGPITWTQQQADDALAKDLQIAENGVRAVVTAALSQQSLAALISFAFNLGLGTLKHSTQLLPTLNAGKYLLVPALMIEFDHVNGEANKGLLLRRLDEATLYLRGIGP